MKLNASEETIKELTMMLMYLTRFSEHNKFLDEEHFYAWKGYNFDVLNQLYIKEITPAVLKKYFLLRTDKNMPKNY